MKDLKFVDCVIKMPLMDLPVRSVLVPVQSGGVLISPGSRLEISQLKSLDPVTDLVAPNLLHCSGIPQAAKVFPLARIWGPQHARAEKPDIRWTNDLSSQTWPYQDELATIEIKGMPRVSEFVFVHKKSKTLIVCDLSFNLTQTSGFGSWLSDRRRS